MNGRPTVSKPLLFMDAAFIPEVLPEADGFAFYLEGGNQEHSWLQADIDRARAKYDYALPIYVRSNMSGHNPQTDANVACSNAKVRGFNGGAIALDIETSENRVYVAVWCNTVRGHGYVPVLYGSESTIQQNNGPHYWVAHYGNFPIPPWAIGIQYHEGGPYDLSHFDVDFADLHMYPKIAKETVTMSFEPPPDLSATPYGTFLDMGWGAPFQYHYQVRDNAGAIVANEVTSSLSVRVSGLHPSANYEWRVSVTPHGEWSTWRSVTTKATDPAS